MFASDPRPHSETLNPNICPVDFQTDPHEDYHLRPEYTGVGGFTDNWKTNGNGLWFKVFSRYSHSPKTSMLAWLMILNWMWKWMTDDSWEQLQAPVNLVWTNRYRKWIQGCFMCVEPFCVFFFCWRFIVCCHWKCNFINSFPEVVFLSLLSVSV